MRSAPSAASRRAASRHRGGVAADKLDRERRAFDALGAPDAFAIFVQQTRRSDHLGKRERRAAPLRRPPHPGVGHARHRREQGAAVQTQRCQRPGPEQPCANFAQFPYCLVYDRAAARASRRGRTVSQDFPKSGYSCYRRIRSARSEAGEGVARNRGELCHADCGMAGPQHRMQPTPLCTGFRRSPAQPAPGLRRANSQQPPYKY